jgi:hypothetical protein
MDLQGNEHVEIGSINIKVILMYNSSKINFL